MDPLIMGSIMDRLTIVLITDHLMVVRCIMDHRMVVLRIMDHPMVIFLIVDLLTILVRIIKPHIMDHPIMVRLIMDPILGRRTTAHHIHRPHQDLAIIPDTITEVITASPTLILSTQTNNIPK